MTAHLKHLQQEREADVSVDVIVEDVDVVVDVVVDEDEDEDEDKDEDEDEALPADMEVDRDQVVKAVGVPHHGVPARRQ